ncbi:MAG: M20/M25/M40 family metallo-hydrolase [bacterium]|nr:M20/M25/M40 family metallo-hydrolase [bacterium]
MADTNDLVRAVIDEVDRLTDEAVDLCRSLVRINTVNPYAGAGPTGSEGDGQAHIQRILESLGGNTRLFEPPPDIYDRMGVIGPRGRSWKGRPNLVTEFDYGPGPRIIVNSHMDTVGVDEMDFDPFCADVKDGKIYGRGSSDDKGGMTMGIMAIKALSKFADSLSGSIIHQSVVDEECSGGGAGTLACCLEGYSADEAIVVDGQELAVTRGCEGVLTATVTVHGKGGHAAMGGVNAIDKAVHVKHAIDRFKAEREAVDPGRLVNLGILHSGSHAAVVPSSATLSLNIIYGLDEAAANEAAGHGWNGSSVRDQFEAAIREADQTDDFLRDHPSTIEWDKDLPPFETPADADLVTGLCDSYKTATGDDPRVIKMKAWGDCAHVSRQLGIPAVMFSCGTRHAAHTQHETVEIADIVKGAKVVAAYLAQRLRKDP